MKKLLSVSIFFLFTFILMFAGTLSAQSTLTQDFESFTLGDSTSIGHVSYSPNDIKTKIVTDPLGSTNKVLKVTTTNYGAAPVLKFVLPAGKTLADYDSLTFMAYYQSGDLSYKLIVASAYQTDPIGHHFLDADTNYSYNRTQGASTAWERISLAAKTVSTFSDTVYIAIGTNNSGATWYLDDVKLVAKQATGPVLGTEQNFEGFTLGDSTSIIHIDYSPNDIKTKIVEDPLGSANKVLKVITTNYGAAPVLRFVLPSGKTLADYDSLTFMAYYQSGDLSYKLIVASAYQTDPIGHHFIDADTNYSYNRTQGASTAWERISLAAKTVSTFSDTVYIAIGTNNSGATWYLDDVKLVAKTVTPPPPPPPPPANLPVVTNGGFEDAKLGPVDSTEVKGWFFQTASGVSPAPDYVIENTDVEQGKQALEVTVHGLGANQWDIQAVGDSLHVKPGHTYNYSIWAKASKAGAQVNLTVGNYSYTEYKALRPVNLTTQWTRYTMQFTVNDNQTVIRAPIHFGYAGNADNPIYIDNLQISDVNAGKVPVIVEAESGKLGSNFKVMQDSTVSYITAVNNYTGLTSPGDTSRMATYNVTFQDSGYYSLFVRVRVGPGGYNDDSFFYGSKFGTNGDTAAADWVFINGLATAGFTDTAAVVNGPGTAGSQVWKWVNVTKNSYQGTPGDSFYVSIDSLTKTFQIGSREDGLDIDKIAFGKSNLYYTVSELDNGLPGTPTLPTVDTTKPYTGPPLASKQPKFVGSAYSSPQEEGFQYYWDQLIPENAGKWGSVEGTKDVMNWTQLDQAYNFAKTNNFVFEYHVLIWGQQQPSWISSLPQDQQLAQIKQWFEAVAQRYPDIDYLQVVNEALNGHNPPDGQNGRANYEDALGGKGTTGYDWVINAFKLARQIFPAKTKLMINDYGILGNTSTAQEYVNLIKLLQADSLIDAIGVQGHTFTVLNASSGTITSCLKILASTGLPIFVTEFDINASDDQIQLNDYKRIFPTIYDFPDVKGITLWGWRPGLWQTNANLINSNGTERPALQWLRTYLDSVNLVTGVNKIVDNKPKSFKLFNNYPNPFNPTTTIKYDVAKDSKVSLIVYDILGREVQTLVNKEQAPGHYTVTFNASNLASGVYIYRITAGNFTATKKLMLLK